MGESDPLGLTPSAWEAYAAAQRWPAYRGRQIFDALHRRALRDYAAATELPGPMRERLARELPIRLPEVARREESADGSVKFGLRLADGALVEAVFIPGDERTARVNEFADARAASSTGEPEGPRGATPPAERFTVCLSSQTGCAVDCAFCVTGRLGAGRNLTTGEVLGQLYAVLDAAGRTWDGLRIVFMGMGEPFLNPDGVLPALEILFELLPPRRVTVSTSGITPAFAAFSALKRHPNLAVSLNAADEATRAKLMPITRTYPLAGLLAAMKAWPLEPRRRVLVEYVLIAGVNDRPEDARRLAKLVAGLPVKVNLIPLNEDPTYLPGWKRPDEMSIDRFARALADARLTVTVRRSKGPDASAACGQLKGRTVDPRKRAPQVGR
ncbi:MAG TPA: 23S rRNA (adenine(2503)-C(2))-methyltransferase RlmN [Thermoanaerobaculia bacterium]|nr:23S rRNA (adenine(2503)-C(2))-methyltransferase RlmN [Thermoanaerobaculia bacterium]